MCLCYSLSLPLSLKLRNISSGKDFKKYASLRGSFLIYHLSKYKVGPLSGQEHKANNFTYSSLVGLSAVLHLKVTTKPATSQRVLAQVGGAGKREPSSLLEKQFRVDDLLAVSHFLQTRRDLYLLTNYFLDCEKGQKNCNIQLQ